MKLSIPTLVTLIAITLISVFYPYNRICYAELATASDKPASDKPKLDFTKFSLEELKNVEIVSVSKKPEKVSEVPAAVYVITQEDIRRSGATSIPEALRLAPGVHVARITATDWAVNIRGLNNEYAKNLLVLIDGRSVYTHLFSGVFWDIQDTVMEDIERIEVIRGPGASIWGANAVNGVINIITKNAKNTQGTKLVVLGGMGGSEEQSASVRYGGNFESNNTYRIYGKFFNRGKLDGVVNALESEYIDFNNEVLPSKEWRSGRAGFRMDLAPGQGLPQGAGNTYTIQGEAYRNRYDKEIVSSIDTTTNISEAAGGNILGRWQHAIAFNNETVLQFYYNYDQKDYDPGSGNVNTTDLDFQHRFLLNESNEVIWGLEYKYIADEFDNSSSIVLDPSNLEQHFVSTFIQDDVTIVPERFRLTLGTKFEHNQLTGLEIQPSIRMRYTPNAIHSFWAAVSRAVRVPSRLEYDGIEYTEFYVSPTETPLATVIYGNDELAAEKLIAYEIGHRWQPTDKLWFNTAVFYNDFHDLIGNELVRQNTVANTYELQYNNNTDGRSYGLEMVSDWQVRDNLLIGLSYTYLHNEIDQNEWFSDGGAPRNIISVRSLWDLAPKLDFDLWLRYVDNVPEKKVSSYTTLDARLAYILKDGLELSLVGQNLFEEGHEEFSDLKVDRSVYAKIDWRF